RPRNPRAEGLPPPSKPVALLGARTETLGPRGSLPRSSGGGSGWSRYARVRRTLPPTRSREREGEPLRDLVWRQPPREVGYARVRRTAPAAASGLARQPLARLGQQRRDALIEARRIVDGRALGDLRLIEEHLDPLVDAGLGAAALHQAPEVLDDRVVRVELEDALLRRKILLRAAQDALEVGHEPALGDHEAERRVGQARGEAHLAHVLLELDAETRAQLTEGRLPLRVDRLRRLLDRQLRVARRGQRHSVVLG